MTFQGNAIGGHPSVPLGAALAEAAYARLERCLLQVRDRLSALSVGGPADPLGGLVGRIDALLRAEEIAAEAAAGATVARGLERALRAQCEAASLRASVVTELGCAEVPSDVSCAIMGATAEFVALAAALPTSGVEEPCLLLTSAPCPDGLVVAVAVRGVVADAADRGEGLVAYHRAERLIRRAGGTLVRGIKDGMPMFGILIDCARAGGGR